MSLICPLLSIFIPLIQLKISSFVAGTIALVPWLVFLYTFLPSLVSSLLFLKKKSGYIMELIKIIQLLLITFRIKTKIFTVAKMTCNVIYFHILSLALLPCQLWVFTCLSCSFLQSYMLSSVTGRLFSPPSPPTQPYSCPFKTFSI